MSKKLGQICYGITPSTGLNVVETITALNNHFHEGKKIIELNVQAYPGTIFHINNNTHTIIIGNTGIYEINLEGFNSSINQLDFEEFPAGNEGYIIVDYVYETGEGI